MRDLGKDRCVCSRCGARHRKRAMNDAERSEIAAAAARARWGNHVPARPRKLKKQVYKRRLVREMPEPIVQQRVADLKIPAPARKSMLRWDSKLNRMVLE